MFLAGKVLLIVRSDTFCHKNTDKSQRKRELEFL